MHPLKLPTLSQPKANILVHPGPPAKKNQPSDARHSCSQKNHPGTNAPTETPNPEPAKSEHNCPPPPPCNKKINPHIPGTAAAKNRPWYTMQPLKLPTLSQPKANILVHPCPPTKKQNFNQPSYSRHSCSQNNQPWYKCTY